MSCQNKVFPKYVFVYLNVQPLFPHLKLIIEAFNVTFDAEQIHAKTLFFLLETA